MYKQIYPCRYQARLRDSFLTGSLLIQQRFSYSVTARKSFPFAFVHLVNHNLLVVLNLMIFHWTPVKFTRQSDRVLSHNSIQKYPPSAPSGYDWSTLQHPPLAMTGVPSLPQPGQRYPYFPSTRTVCAVWVCLLLSRRRTFLSRSRST